MQYQRLSDLEKEILVQEKQPDCTYVFTSTKAPKYGDSLTIRLEHTTVSRNFGFGSATRFLKDAFLPQGYPSSVSSDYLNYQLWDTVQAFCSTINGTLTTHAIFKGVGVGDQDATALAATITWIMKDGTGMIGRIGFAWWKGFSLDTDCKKWRLVADVTNDIAMCVELLLGSVLFKNYGPILLCTSTGMKAIVGVAGGATRAAITQHQAIRGNMGDVSAKDGSQETFVNLIASFFGIYILSCIENQLWCIWTLFFVNTALHVFANYKAVRSLNIKTMNDSRLLLVVEHFLRYNVPCTPSAANRRENVFLGFGISDRKLCSRKIKLGSSLKKCVENGSSSLSVHSLKNLRNMYRMFPYVISYNEKIISVILHENISNREIIKAYFHAAVLGVVISWPRNRKTLFHLHDEIYYLIEKCRQTELCEIYVNDFVQQKWEELSSALISDGWNLNVHQILVEEFRIKWS